MTTAELLDNHWPEGCELFEDKDDGKCLFLGDDADDSSLAWLFSFSSQWKPNDKKMVAHVAHSWFTRIAQRAWSEPGHRRADIRNPCPLCVIAEKAEESAAAWAEWGGI